MKNLGFEKLLSIMKENVLFVLKKLLFELLPYAIVFFFYRQLVGWTVALALSVVLATYAAAMVISAFGTKRMLAYERSEALTNKRLILCTLAVASPIYFLWIILSIIPIVNYNIWFLTGFPVAVISAFPLIAISGHYSKRWRVLFYLLHVLLYIFLLTVGQILGRAFLPLQH